MGRWWAVSRADTHDESFKDSLKDKVTPTGDAWAYFGGALAVLVAVGVHVLAGSVYSGAEALELFKALSNSSVYLGVALTSSGATVLALMLTMIGMARRADESFDTRFYQRIGRIGALSAALLCSAVLLLIVLGLPADEFENVPPSWYTGLYYVAVGLIALLAGLAITTILMLFNAVKYVVLNVTPAEHL